MGFFTVELLIWRLGFGFRGISGFSGFQICDWCCSVNVGKDVDGGKQTQIRKYYLYFLFGIDQVLLFLRVLVLVLSLLLFLHIDFDVKFQINLGFHDGYVDF